jgi:hypothetical protein
MPNEIVIGDVHACRDERELAAEVLLVSIQPLLNITKHAGLADIETLLRKAIVLCGAHSAPLNTQSVPDADVSVDYVRDGRSQSDLMNQVISKYRHLQQRQHNIRRLEIDGCHEENVCDRESALDAVEAAMSVFAWLAVTLPAQSEAGIRAKAEILLDRTGHDKTSLVDQLAWVLCSEVLTFCQRDRRDAQVA